MGFWIFLLLSLVVGLLIFFTRGSDSDSAPSSSASSSTSELEKKLSTSGLDLKAKSASKETPFVGIYLDVTRRAVKRCVCCDGENDLTRKICRICGNKIER